MGLVKIYIIPVIDIPLLMTAKDIASFGYGVLIELFWSFIPDALEYAEYNTGKYYPEVVNIAIGSGL